MVNMVNVSKDSGIKVFAVRVVGDVELSKAVQKYLFDEFDAAWQGDSYKRLCTENYIEILVVRKTVYGYRISYAGEYYYNTELRQSIPLVQVTTVTEIKVKSMRMERETVEIDGKVYDKAEVLKAIDALKSL